eukprot:scaffold106083_cov45-Phaeocystis_antarctica.AAC.2
MPAKVWLAGAAGRTRRLGSATADPPHPRPSSRLGHGWFWAALCSQECLTEPVETPRGSVTDPTQIRPACFACTLAGRHHAPRRPAPLDARRRRRGNRAHLATMGRCGSINASPNNTLTVLAKHKNRRAY